MKILFGDHKIRAALGGIAVCVLALAATLVIARPFQDMRAPATALGPQEQTLGERIRLGEVPPPALSSTTAARLAQSRGFQVLISYTDDGFAPREIKIARGDAVRFVDNASRPVWFAAAGPRLYPKTTDSCGSSDLDTCGPIEPQDFWEFTFTEAGTWHVVDNLDKTMSVVVNVQ